MYTQAEKTKENRRRAAVNSVAQKKNNGKQGFGFEDSRREVITQRKLQNCLDPKRGDQSPSDTKRKTEATGIQCKGVEVIQRQNAVLASQYPPSQAVKQVLMNNGYSDRPQEAGRDDVLVVCSDETEVTSATVLADYIREQIRFGATLPCAITLVVCNAAIVGAAGATFTSLGQELANRIGVPVRDSRTAVYATWDAARITGTIAGDFVEFRPQTGVDEITEKIENFRF